MTKNLGGRFSKMNIKGNRVNTSDFNNKAESCALDLEESKYLLERDLEWFLNDYISNQPKEIQDILRIKPKTNIYRWESEVINGIINLMDSNIKSEAYRGIEKASYCPLCENGLNKSPKVLADGYKIPVGLKRHLKGTNGAKQCIIIKTLSNQIRNRY